VNMKHKNMQAAISLFVMCALFLAPVAVRPCETTEVPEQSCCCCPCCQETESSPSESHPQKDECSCRMAEKHDEENSPAVLVSDNDDKPQISLLTLEIKGSFECQQGRPLDSGSRNLILPSRDHPLYILHSSFLI
jgi:hypothetical protein